MSVQDAVKAAPAKYAKFFKDGDFKAIAEQMYTANCYGLLSHFPAINGRDDVAKTLAGIAAKGVNGVTIQSNSLSVEGNVAIETGSYTFQASGQTVDSGNFVHVWKQEGGSWKYSQTATVTEKVQ